MDTADAELLFGRGHAIFDANLHLAVSVAPSICHWAAAPKGSMSYAFTHMGNFLLLLLLLLRPPPLKSQSQGPNPSLEAQIPVL